MNELFVALLTLLPVAGIAWVGFRRGGRDLLPKLGPVLLAAPVASAVAWTGFRGGWFRPFGLVTPILLGLFAALLIFPAARRLLRRDPETASEPPETSRRDRTAGAILGAGLGFALACSLWLVAGIAEGLTTPRTPTAPPPEPVATDGEETLPLWRGVVRTAHRGFLRHLPGIGPASDEFDALLRILDADPETQLRLAETRGWTRLAERPAFRAVLEDPRILEGIEQVHEGDVTALYRLQRDPLILALVEDPAFRAVAAGLRPTLLAAELDRLEQAD